MWSNRLSKIIGTSHEIVCDKDKKIVTVFSKGKAIHTAEFPKLYMAINFYAAIKHVKQINNLESLFLQCLRR